MSKAKRVVIGVTGSLSSGKSTVSKVFASMGAKVIDADTLVDRIYSQNSDVRLKLRRVFGNRVFDEKGCLRKRELGEIVFNDKRKLSRLNRIVHPVVKGLIIDVVRGFKRGILVVDAALLVETGLNRLMDKVVVVDAPLKLRIKRASKVHNFSIKQARQRISFQLSFKEKAKHADFIIYNRAGKKELSTKAKQIFREVTDGN